MTLKEPLIVLEDVYITGLLAQRCKMARNGSLKFKYMGIKNYCRVDYENDVVFHRVNITKMHKRIFGLPTESGLPLCNDHL